MQAIAACLQHALLDASICVCNSVAFKLVTWMEVSAACAKHTATLHKPGTLQHAHNMPCLMAPSVFAAQ